MPDKTIAQEVAEFIFALKYEDIPEECVQIAKRCFIDGIGVILAGSTEPCAEACRKLAQSINGSNESSVLGNGSFKVPAEFAALVNGTAGHAHDWDDSALSKESDRSVLLHPTMQPLTALLALAERDGIGGKEILTAFIAGVDVSCKIAESIDPSHFSQGRGFHTSGTIGVFGATAAAAKLLRLDVDQIRNALGLAASMAAGIGVSHGTMAKPLHMGRSAENGITAAKLASFGMDARSEVFEGVRGYFQCFGGGYDPAWIRGRFGNPFSVIEPGICIKPYPSGVVGHPGMDLMKELVTAHDIKPEDVERVKVYTGTNVLPPGPLRYSFAESALEGKFCVQFQMASIIARRKAGMMEFTDEFVVSPEIQELQKKIETVVDPEIEALGKGVLKFKIEIVCKDGTSESGVSEEHYRGGPDNPLTRDSLIEKFVDSSQNVLFENQANKAVVILETLEEQANLDKLLECIAVVG